jgi:glutamate/tyrosine decarboxylase-like PLP-dependent enzyme
LPEKGSSLFGLLPETTEMILNHSLYNGHPRFLGYITSSAAPVGALADMLAASVNPNVGAWNLSPIASEIEAQTIRWIAELIGYPTDCGGLLVSGGNAANFVPFLTARAAKSGWNVRTQGMQAPDADRLRVYCSAETHTWIEKAADHYGLGTDAIRWIETDAALRMDTEMLRAAIERDLQAGDKPFLVVGTGGSTAVGAIDPLPEIAKICQEYELWFHVDAAYGGFAACLPNMDPNLRGLSLADSVAIDPHKWLYTPLEAGCVLVRDPQTLVSAFSYHPVYYEFDQGTEEAPINYYEYGPQNSRGFRALKVWLALQQVGRQGYVQMISKDCQLATRLYDIADGHPELEALTANLSITTFRYVPSDLDLGSQAAADYLNELNSELLTLLQRGGEVFLSNALINKKYALRSCVVNFRTSVADIQAIPEIVTRVGGELDRQLRPAALRSVQGALV